MLMETVSRLEVIKLITRSAQGSFMMCIRHRISAAMSDVLHEENDNFDDDGDGMIITVNMQGVDDGEEMPLVPLPWE